MKVLRGDPSGWDAGSSGHALAVGVFDGVHVGHRHVLAILRDQAAECGLEPGVLTFDPHPLTVVIPDRAPAMLTSLDHRIELLDSQGVEVVAVLDFDAAVREWSPATFVTETLAGALAAEMVVVGEDFRFGKDRTGHVGLLREMGNGLGFRTEIVPLVGEDRPLSSTQIREMIAEGDVAGAAVALARPHELWGGVVEGSGRGRTIGVPTANLALPPGVAVPKRGVYAVTAGRSADESIPGVANVGVRPTFDGTDETVEAHLLGFEGDLYGEILRVRFVDRIRDERKFDAVEGLVGQIGRDIEAARAMLVGGTGNG